MDVSVVDVLAAVTSTKTLAVVVPPKYSETVSPMAYIPAFAKV